jgi:hypothetical protein
MTRALVPALVVAVSGLWYGQERVRDSLPGRAEQGPSCAVSIIHQSPLVDRNGNRISVDAAYAAVRNMDVAVVGTPTLVWSSDARIIDSSAIGVVTDASGRTVPLSSPFGNRRVLYSRIAPRSSGGWHVLLATGIESGALGPLAVDTGSLWYAYFDANQWRELTRVTSIAGSYLRPGFASQLFADGDDLAFAFGFRDRSLAIGQASKNGAAFVARTSGTWKIDSLHTWGAPQFVQLARTAIHSRFVATVVHPYFDDRTRRIRPPALFAATHDTTWEPERLVFADSSSLGFPVPWTANDALAVSWLSYSGQTFQLEWAMSSTLPFRSTRHLASGRGFDRPVSLPLSATRTMWLARDGKTRDGIEVFMRSGHDIKRVAALRVPFDNSSPLALKLADSTVGLFTISLDTAGRPLSRATTIFTRIGVKCP